MSYSLKKRSSLRNKCSFFLKKRFSNYVAWIFSRTQRGVSYSFNYRSSFPLTKTSFKETSLYGTSSVFLGLISHRFFDIALYRMNQYYMTGAVCYSLLLGTQAALFGGSVNPADSAMIRFWNMLCMSQGHRQASQRHEDQERSESSVVTAGQRLLQPKLRRSGTRLGKICETSRRFLARLVVSHPMRHGNLLLLHYIYSHGMSLHGFSLTFIHVHTSQRAKPGTCKMDSKMDSDQVAQECSHSHAHQC